MHPGWIRTNGRADNPAPLSSYEAAGILKQLFEERRYDKEGHRFITNEGADYPSWLYTVLHGATTIWEHWEWREGILRRRKIKCGYTKWLGK